MNDPNRDLARYLIRRTILFLFLNLLTVASFSYLFWLAAFSGLP